jgi:hypothetical protein
MRRRRLSSAQTSYANRRRIYPAECTSAVARAGGASRNPTLSSLASGRVSLGHPISAGRELFPCRPSSKSFGRALESPSQIGFCVAGCRRSTIYGGVVEYGRERQALVFGHFPQTDRAQAVYLSKVLSPWREGLKSNSSNVFSSFSPSASQLFEPNLTSAPNRSP